MKEATGELNMTVITLIAIAAIGAVFYFVVWPIVQASLVSNTCRSAYGPDFQAVRGAERSDAGNATTFEWTCVNEATGECYDSETGQACD